jgi:hypothetical protein
LFFCVYLVGFSSGWVSMFCSFYTLRTAYGLASPRPYRSNQVCLI